MRIIFSIIGTLLLFCGFLFVDNKDYSAIAFFVFCFLLILIPIAQKITISKDGVELLLNRLETTKKEFEESFSVFLPITIALAESGNLSRLRPRPRLYFYNVLQKITKP